MNQFQKQNQLHREFMKNASFEGTKENSDQTKGLPQPSYEAIKGGNQIEIPVSDDVITNNSYSDLLFKRRSARSYSDTPMTKSQLAFLLWSSYSVQSQIVKDATGRIGTYRPVPSGGGCHSFEIYFAALNIEGLEAGIYHYLPMQNVGEKKVTIERLGDLPNSKIVADMVLGQSWVNDCGALFLISSIPARGEWRYGPEAHRMMMTDLGYLGQNLGLSAEALNLGSCQIAGYEQALCDQAVSLDGENEFIVLGVAVGSR